MTKGEWLESHGINYMSHTDPTEEADDNWVKSMEILYEFFDEIYEDEEE